MVKPPHGPFYQEVNPIMKGVSKIFLTGLAATVPIAITVYVLFWLGTSAERLFGAAVRFTAPALPYRTGMGLAIGVIVIFLVGLFMRAWIVRKAFDLAEGLVARVPFVKTVYGSARDLLTFVTNSGGREFDQVVSLTLPPTEFRLLGFITRDDLHKVADGLGAPGDVAVYLPLSYQIGGHTVLVPRSAVTPVDMSMHEAMRFAITAGMSTTVRAAAAAPVE